MSWMPILDHDLVLKQPMVTYGDLGIPHATSIFQPTENLQVVICHSLITIFQSFSHGFQWFSHGFPMVTWGSPGIFGDPPGSAHHDGPDPGFPSRLRSLPHMPRLTAVTRSTGDFAQIPNYYIVYLCLS